MECREYQTLFESESSHWWYRGLHAVLLDILEQQGVDRTSRVLDAGCGTGLNLANISNAISSFAFGVDLSPYAVPYWRYRGLKRVCLASVNNLPFPDSAFDAVVCIDVLECDAVMEERAFGELWRVVCEDGLIVIVVPAYEWLLTKQHHRAVHASRRYTKKTLLSLLQTRPSRLIRVSYMFTLLFPAIATYRLALRLFSNGVTNSPRSELRRLPWFVNDPLFRIMAWERLLLRVKNLPFGSSLLAVVKKGAQR